MADDIELEDGDAVDEQDAPIERDDTALEDGGDDVDDTPTENKWNARRSLSEMLEDEDADKAKPASSSSRKPATPTAKSEEPAGDDDDELDEDEDLDEDDDVDEDGEPSQDPKSSQASKGEGASGKPRYAVKGADGKAFEFELEKGTSIQFKADGRDVEVKSMDELVQLAQKGAAFDRKTSEQGQHIQRLAARETELQQTVDEVRKTAEETLLAALFNRDARQKLRAALAPFRDPAYREGVEAKAQLAQQKEQAKESQQAEVETKRAEFWAGVGSEIRKELANAEHLTDDDAIEVATRFHNGYARAYEAKFAELRAAGVPEAKANADANAHAFSYFNEKNLRRVVRGLNAELAEERKSVAKTKGGKTRPGKPASAAAATAEATAHNKKLDQQLERRRRTPRLQGGGASPGGSSGRTPQDSPAKPRTFAQRMDGLGRMLRNGAND